MANISFTKAGDKYEYEHTCDGESALFSVDFLGKRGTTPPSVLVYMRTNDSFEWENVGSVAPKNGGTVVNFAVSYPEGCKVKLVTNVPVKAAKI